MFYKVILTGTDIVPEYPEAVKPTMFNTCKSRSTKISIPKVVRL